VRFGLLAFGSTTEPTVIESCRKVFISTGHSYMDSWMWDGLGYAGSGVTTGFTADDAVFAAATSHWRIAGGTEPVSLPSSGPLMVCAPTRMSRLASHGQEVRLSNYR
jgi:hypothetical protein